MENKLKEGIEKLFENIILADRLDYQAIVILLCSWKNNSQCAYPDKVVTLDAINSMIDNCQKAYGNLSVCSLFYYTLNHNEEATREMVYDGELGDDEVPVEFINELCHYLQMGVIRNNRVDFNQLRKIFEKYFDNLKFSL